MVKKKLKYFDYPLQSAGGYWVLWIGDLKMHMEDKELESCWLQELAGWAWHQVRQSREANRPYALTGFWSREAALAAKQLLEQQTWVEEKGEKQQWRWLTVTWVEYDREP